MREIKFKAWDKNLKKMLNKKHGLQIEFYKNNGYGIWRNRLPGETGIWKSKRFSKEEIILLQYTGLKDKNGKEIYEGDIVEYPDASGYCFEDVYTNIGVVYFDLKNGIVFSNRYSVEMEDIEFDSDVEVIGNIYENPELIG